MVDDNDDGAKVRRDNHMLSLQKSIADQITVEKHITLFSREENHPERAGNPSNARIFAQKKTKPMLDFTSVDLIQAMLAPGIMISACGLLLLGTNNKYSLVVNRIRVLEEEKRKLVSLKNKQPLEDEQNRRLNSIHMQVERFAYRIKLVRNTVFFYTMGVAFFILASLSIGGDFFLSQIELQSLSVALFLAGMISVLAGVIHAAREVWKGYEIVKIEIVESEV